MRTKIQLYTVALCIGLLGLVNNLAATTNYYLKAGTSYTVMANWGTSTNGNGATHPTGLTAGSINWNFNNNNASVTLIANWSLASSSSIVVGDGSNAISLNLASFNFGSSGKVVVNNLGTLNSSSLSLPLNSASTFNTGSTVNLSGNGASIPNNGVGFYNLTLSGTSASLSAYTIVNGSLSANAIVLNGYELDLNGGISSLGTVTGDLAASIYITNGTNLTLSMNQTTSGTSNALNILSYDDGGAGNTLTIGNALCIFDGAITPVSGTIATGGNLTLLADQTTVGNTGAIGTVGGSITGNITSQIYHAPASNQTNWTLIGTAGVSNAAFTQWESAFQITCASCAAGNGSAQNGGTAFTSVTTYDEPTDTYPGISSDATTISPGIGYWVFMGNSYVGTSSSNELIAVTGTPVTGDFPVSLTTAGGVGADADFNLIANPYPSPISANSLLIQDGDNSSATDGNIYAYSTVDQAYSTLNASTGVANATGSGFQMTDCIPTGMGFYVLAASTTSLTFHEYDKNPGSTQELGRLANPKKHGLTTTQSSTVTPHFRLDVAGSSAFREVAVSFSSGGTLGRDKCDALPMSFDGVLQLTTASQGTFYIINGLPTLTQNYSLPVRIVSGTTATYTISAKDLQYIDAGPCVILHDNYNQIPDQDLRAGSCIVSVSDTETVSRFVLNITVTPLNITTNTKQASCPITTNGLITAVGNDAGPWNYIWKNASSIVVQTHTNVATTDTLKGLNSGVYSVNVTTVGSCNDATQTFTLVAPSAPISAFTAPTTVNVGANVNFTNNSTNATNYIWYFGDGGISSLQSPNYVYNTPGMDTVTLYAIIASCNDTVSSTQVLEVEATTDIKQISSGNGNVVLNKDEGGYYVQFNYEVKTNAIISVQNLLGEKVVTDISQDGVSTNKTYIPLGNTANNVLIISVTTSAGEKTFRKVVNTQ